MVPKQITMAHGSGGKDSAELMSQIFEKYFGNDILSSLEDAASIETDGKVAVSTDSFVVTPLIFKGGDIGKLSVCGTLNDLLSVGADPKYLTCGFILEEGLEIPTLERIVSSMADEAARSNVKFIAGDTKVIEGSGGLFINTTGIGRIAEGRDISARNMRPGDELIVTGDLGDHHACILSARLNIENDIKSDCAVLSDITDSLFNNNIRVRTIRDITRGGLGTVLNEIAASSKVSIEVEESGIPVNTQVRSFCDLLGLDPMYMGNEGKMVVAVDPADTDKALEVIRETAAGKKADVIGKVKGGSGVTMKTLIGGTRKVDMLYGEGLPRIC